MKYQTKLRIKSSFQLCQFIFKLFYFIRVIGKKFWVRRSFNITFCISSYYFITLQLSRPSIIYNLTICITLYIVKRIYLSLNFFYFLLCLFYFCLYFCFITFKISYTLFKISWNYCCSSCVSRCRNRKS